MNVKYFTLYDLRRSSITDWAEALPVHVVQKLAGHSDNKTTQRYYLSVRASDSEKARVFSVDILPNDLTDPLLTHSCKDEGGARQDRKMGWMQTSASKHFTKSRPAGLEPATYGLEIRCSIQLSYERFFSKPLQYSDFPIQLSTALTSKSIGWFSGDGSPLLQAGQDIRLPAQVHLGFDG